MKTTEQAWDDFVKTWEKKHGRLYPVMPAHSKFPFETVEPVRDVAFDEFMKKVMP